MKTECHLKLFIDPIETNLLALYKTAVEKHNNDILNNPYPNAGFDLYIPSNVITTDNTTVWIDHKVKATMTERICSCSNNSEPNTNKPTPVKNIGKTPCCKRETIARGYCIYPRSSLSKTPLMLANHVGIIDSGYSGNLIGAFRHIVSNLPEFTIEKEIRLLQICHPSLLPFTIEIVENEQSLFDGIENTIRGSGGFGSTGK